MKKNDRKKVAGLGERKKGKPRYGGKGVKEEWCYWSVREVGRHGTARIEKTVVELTEEGKVAEEENSKRLWFGIAERALRDLALGGSKRASVIRWVKRADYVFEIVRDVTGLGQEAWDGVIELDEQELGRMIEAFRMKGFLE